MANQDDLIYCSPTSTPRKTLYANLFERRDSVLGVFAFNKLGMNCCSGDSKSASSRFQNGKPQRTQTLSLGRKAHVQ
jgi:hypothetical protein